MTWDIAHPEYVYSTKDNCQFYMSDQKLQILGDGWSAFFSGFGIADKHISDKPFLLNREGEFDVFFIEGPFMSLILLPNESNFQDDCFPVDDIKEGEFK